MILTNLFLLSSMLNSSIHDSYWRTKNSNFIEINQILLASENVGIEKIGIVDFRYILKKSNAMKVLGENFISIENEMNKKIIEKQNYLKNKELKIKKQKKNLSTQEYNNLINLFKSEVSKVQKQFKQERSILNNSFQNIQNRLKDMLAEVIKNVSIKKQINVVLLKENVFLYNKASLDMTNEVLQIFNEKTKSLKIVIRSTN